MKKFYFFIIAAFASISLMGQAGIKNLQQDSDFYKNKKGSHYKRNLYNLSSSQNDGLKSMEAFIYQLDSTRDENFSTDPDLWSKSAKEEFFYNSDKKLASYFWYEYDDIDKLWIEYIKEDVFYDNNGSLTEVKISYYNTEIDVWVVSEKIEFTYNDGGNITLMSEFVWDEDSNGWMSDGTVEYFYDINGVLVHIVYYNDEKEEYAYDVNGRLSDITIYYYDTNVWKNGSKEEYVYNSNDQVISIPGYYWDSDIGDWVNYTRNEYSYDANGNPVEEINFDNSGLGNELIAQRKYEYNYDLDYNLSNLIIPSLNLFYPDFSEKIVNKPLNYFLLYLNESTSKWWTSSRTTYYYSEQEIGNGILSNTNEASIFPNPASEYIEVSLGYFSPSTILYLFDMLGKKLLSQRISQSGKVPIAHLNSGLYIYKLIDDNTVLRGKILIE